MEIINNNPYRRLGVYSTSSQKEFVAIQGNMKVFLKTGKNVCGKFQNAINRILLLGILAVTCVSCDDGGYKEYMSARDSHDIAKLQQFINQHPNSEYAEDAQRNIDQILDDNSFERALHIGSVDMLNQYLDQYPDGLHRYEAKHSIDSIEREIIRKELEKWKDNSLQTGSTPYRQYYGGNFPCDDWGCSVIRVTAPYNSDIVVTIKKGGETGYVVRHAFIQSGMTYRFEIPNGRYQCFFYYGKGWNPNKQMTDVVRGGFVSNESFSKTDVEYLENAELSYVLQVTKNGNFSTQPSNEDQMF